MRLFLAKGLIREFAIIFDCTPHIGELAGIVARYLDKNWVVHQVLLGVRHADKNQDTDGLGILLHGIVEHDLGLKLSQVLATMRDAANLNGAVLDALRIHLKQAADVACFSHMLNRVGEALDAPLVAEFMGHFVQHMGHSAQSISDFKKLFGVRPENPNQNRWYYWVEQYENVLKTLPGLLDFLRSRDVHSNTISGMISLLTGPQRKPFILQLSTLANIGRLIGDICYELEGDGPLIFNTYELYLRSVQILSIDARLPGAVMEKVREFSIIDGILSEDDYHANEAICRAVLFPARQYLAGQAAKEVVSKSIHIAKVAAMWNPLKVHGMSLNANMLAVPLLVSSFIYQFI